ncbi:hypothetical protein LL270_10535 [Pseudomonas aestusnigri]|uniref:hypothetical protein n=1 Tax=Halopseudomonas aestusnigri TaxID=857252 RepID=UPI001D17F0A3|nr:hypothetical protein [Halopseudomonas aestusnigri]MCC4261090.1 hypothetical protein [Halopseudomonas aestusnigri]
MDGQTCSQCDERAMDNGSGLCEPHFEARREAIRDELSRPVPAQTRSRRAHLQRKVLTVGRLLRLTLVTVLVAPPAFFGVLFLLGEAGVGSGSDSAATFGEARVAVEELLRDPGSAVFSNEVRGSGSAVCGRVRAKNGFGGYAAAQRYVYLPGTAAVLEGGQSSPDFVLLWQAHCR